MFYENFEKLCNLKGVKPSTVSKATGISTATLTSWKQGKYTPKNDKLGLIANYFEVPLDYLITGEENPRTKEAKQANEFLVLFNSLNPEEKENIIEMMKLLKKK